ncbi:MAG: AAA family ATPase [Promethearchaeota archaeon]
MIESIRVKNFRRHKDLRLEFDEKFNLIHGRNNAGKSTIFYAIEYCLFGSVLGFKKISQLASFKSKDIGVEIIFKVKNGDQYKLQRMHKITGKSRSAKGVYTLKQFQNDSESYILSSDFGDPEEKLSLKIKEIIGISKRFFETGLHFQQGSISEILIGSKKLDIVFGITAATTLADVFRARALEFKKEAKNIEILKITFKQSKKDKKEQVEKQYTQEKKHHELQTDIKIKEKHLMSFKSFKNSVENISKYVESFNKVTKTRDDIKIREEMVSKEIQECIQKYGKKSELSSKLEAINKEGQQITEKISTLDIKTETFQSTFRDIEREKGDIEGILTRREETKDKPMCEYCGASIDPKKIVKEVKSLKEKLNTLDSMIKDTEVKENETKKQIEEMREKEKESDALLTTFKTQLERFSELETKREEFKKELEMVEKGVAIEKENLIKNFISTRENIKEEISKMEKDEFANSLTQVVEKMEVKEKDLTLENIVKVRDELNELIISKISKLTTTIDHLSSQQKEIEDSINEMKDKILELDKQIAFISKEISYLQKKELLSKLYKDYQNIFTDIQSIIRKNASNILSEEILDIHQTLSSDDEFEKISIDSDDYSLSIVPKGMDIGESYPAAIYEGGGHKLILGLAYKIALGKLIGSPPFLLIDEPTEFMDTRNRGNLLSNISSISEQTQVLLVTHQDIDKINCEKKIELEK